MKTYRQISYGFEYKVVFSYAGIMCLLNFFILLSPVFAQVTDPLPNNEPRVHYDVKKEYDKDGNLTGYDSTFSWYWQGESWQMPDDSILRQFKNQFHLFDDPIDWGRFSPLFPGITKDNSWFWNDLDLSDLFGNDSVYGNFHFNKKRPQIQHITIPDFWSLPYMDSLGISFFNFDDLSKYLDDEFNTNKYLHQHKDLKNMYDEEDEFIRKLKEYQLEHQKLIEKYFGLPQYTQPDQKSEPQHLKLPQKPADQPKTGKV